MPRARAAVRGEGPGCRGTGREPRAPHRAGMPWPRVASAGSVKRRSRIARRAGLPGPLATVVARSRQCRTRHTTKNWPLASPALPTTGHSPTHTIRNWPPAEFPPPETAHSADFAPPTSGHSTIRTAGARPSHTIRARSAPKTPPASSRWPVRCGAAPAAPQRTGHSRAPHSRQLATTHSHCQ